MLLLIAVLACGGAPAEPPKSAPAAPTALVAREDTDVDGLKAAMDEGAIVVDVRTPEEYAAGHVPGAKNIPIDLLDPYQSPTSALPKDQPIYVICHTGRRSARGADVLAAAGYHAINVTGGTEAWLERGWPTESAPSTATP